MCCREDINQRNCKSANIHKETYNDLIIVNTVIELSLTLWSRLLQVDRLLWELSSRWRSCALVEHEDVVLAHRCALRTFPLVEGVKQEVIFLQEDVGAVSLVARSIGRLLCSQDVVLKESTDVSSVSNNKSNI